MRFLSKPKEGRKEVKRAGREMAKMGWGLNAPESSHTGELEQLHMSRGKGHHLARSFKGHV
jgi:hypothetical protein